MHRFPVLFTIGAALVALSSAACGDSNKPPLTPDTEHSIEVPEAGAPEPPATAAPAESAPSD